MPEEIQVQRIKKHKSILGRAQGAGMIHIQGFDIPFTIVPSFETIENIRKTYQLNPQNCCIITTANKSTKEQLEQQFGYRVGWVKVSGDDEERYRRFSDVWGRMFSEEAGVNKSYFSVLGLSREEREALTPTDKAILRLLHDFPPAFPEKITIDTLRSHFQENEKMGVKKCEIVIMGCPSYNNFGDDIEPQMIPSRRDEMVNYVVSMLERNSEIIDKHVTLVTVGPDILNYWMTRYCLPPFDDTILSLMESDDPEEVEKLKEKLRISQSLIQEVADLLSQRGIPTNVQSYVSFINTNGKGENEELMEDIDRWVRDNPKIHDPIAEEIRASRAKSYPNYATDRNGVPIEKYKVIRRVKGNSVIYYGMADRLVRNRNEKKPNKILISSEGDAGYWRAYAAEIAKAHGVFPETVLMFHKDFRQPWGADRNREEQISFAAWEKIHDKAA